ncbi:hypothetical protein FWF89_00425 [Candidatus Saccharibacteria bacterium]|jgi:signal transduction histidine kinase|nr:hypothetical protein [Candidatus Saccharibacteria bacterium]
MAKVSDTLISLYKIALPFCERKKIALNLDLSDSSLTVDLDQRQLASELKPYLQDAILRTKHNGAITIGAQSAPRKSVEIFIKDTGEAIPKNERAAITENPNIDLHSRHGYGTTITISYPRG